MQAAALGMDVPEDGPPHQFQRGDLLYWRGHIGIMRDTGTLLHANAYHMAVVSEPVADAMSRIDAKGTPLLAVRRMTANSPGV
jgi:hypothetical protein